MAKPNLAILISASVISASVAAAALGLTVTAAHAASGRPRPATSGAGTWSVSPMNQFDEPSNIGLTVLSDPNTGGAISCKFSGGAIKPPGGMGLRGTLVTISGLAFSQCTLPDGTSVTLNPGSSSWTMTGRQFDPSRNLGVTSGRLHGVSMSFSSTSCSGVFDGTAAGANDGGLAYQYYNNPHWLVVHTYASTLHAYNVSGCSGIFNNGDTVTMHVVWSFLALVISSP